MKTIGKEHEIEKTLESFSEVKRISPRPFFYTRLEARMKKQKETITRAEWTWSMAVVIILLMFNIYILSGFENLNNIEAENDDPIELLSEEYTLNTFDIYEDQLKEIEEDEPY